MRTAFTNFIQQMSLQSGIVKLSNRCWGWFGTELTWGVRAGRLLQGNKRRCCKCSEQPINTLVWYKYNKINGEYFIYKA